MTNAQRRLTLQNLMWKTVNLQKAFRNWQYREARPLPIQAILFDQAVYSDCSFGCKLLCYSVGGIPDPTGFDYNGYGNSESIRQHLPKISQAEARPGDIIVWYGIEDEEHAAMLYKWEKVDGVVHCFLWNMGMQGQPVFSTLGRELAAHPGASVQWCQVLRPDPAPTTKGR